MAAAKIMPKARRVTALGAKARRLLALGMLAALLSLPGGTPAGAVEERAGAGQPGPQALTARALDNLVAYVRLLGYIRYFHPSDAAAAADWDTFTVRTIRSVEPVPDAPALAARLQALFDPYAPTLRVFVTGQTPTPIAAALQPPGGQGVDVVQWRYKAFNVEADVSPSTQRIRAPFAGQVPDGYSNPSQPYLADLGGGVSALVPLALFADARGTLPHTSTPQPAGGSPTPGHLEFWLADIAITWNAVQHFYPYWDTLTVDWQAALRTALSAVSASPDADTFYRALRTLLGLLNDGHVSTARPLSGGTSNSVLPLAWDWVQDRLVVVRVARKPATHMRVGDQVLAIDGRPVADILAAPDNATGGTPAYRRWVVLQSLLYGDYNSAVALQMQSRNGHTYALTLHRGSYNVQPEQPEPRPKQAVATLAPGIMYLDMTRILQWRLTRAMKQLVKARGIILDGRGYPPDFTAMFDLYQHLSSTPMHVGRYLIPIVTYPDHQHQGFQDETEYLQVLRPRIKAKLVFLINANDTVSRAEHFLVLAEGYHLGQLVGSHTAGSNGERTRLDLPDGYKVWWTGIRTLKVDGSQLMHVGVLPTVEADRTVEGVVAGRDEVLQRGLHVLKSELAAGCRCFLAHRKGY